MSGIMKLCHEYLVGGARISWEEVDHGPVHKFFEGDFSPAAPIIWDLSVKFDSSSRMFGLCWHVQPWDQGLIWWEVLPKYLWLYSRLHLLLSKMREKRYGLGADVYFPAKTKTPSQRSDINFVKILTAIFFRSLQGDKSWHRLHAARLWGPW